MADSKVSALTTIPVVDRAADSLYIVDTSAGSSNKVTPNGLLGITGSPVGTSDSQTLTSKTLTSPTINTPTITVLDNALTIQDNADTTKQAQFQLSGITTGNTRTYTLPDYNATLASLAGTETLTNKTLSAPTITNPTLTVDTISEFTAANGVNVDGLLIKDGLLPAGNIQPLNLASGAGSSWAWQTWSPTWVNLSVGNGTVTAKYIQIGKTVFFRLNLVFGSTTSITGTPTFTLPVTSVALVGTDSAVIGVGKYLDSGTAAYEGLIMLNSTTTGQLQLANAGGTYVSYAGISSTTPMTWTTSDEVKFLNGCYEVA